MGERQVNVLQEKNQDFLKLTDFFNPSTSFSCVLAVLFEQAGSLKISSRDFFNKPDKTICNVTL